MSLTPQMPPVAWHAFDQAVMAVRGADAVDLLHRLCSQNLRPMGQPGVSAAALLLTAQGKLVQWLNVWSAAEGLYLAVAADAGAATVRYLEGYTIAEDVTYTVLGERVPCAHLLWDHAATGADAAAAPPVTERQARPWSWTAADAGVQDAAATTLPHAFLLPAPKGFAGLTLVGTSCPTAALLQAEALPRLWSSITGADLARAAEQLGAPVDPQVWRHARLLAGRPAWGEEVEAGAMPFVHRLGREAVAWNKGCYVGQEVLSRLDSYNKVARLTMGFDGQDAAAIAALAQSGEPLRVMDGERSVGKVSSWVARPEAALQPSAAVVGLAVIKQEAAIAGATLALAADAKASSHAPVPIVLRERTFWQA